MPLDPKAVIVGDVVKHVPTGRLYIVNKVGLTNVYCYAFGTKAQISKRKDQTVNGFRGRPYRMDEMAEADFEQCEAAGLLD